MNRNQSVASWLVQGGLCIDVARIVVDYHVFVFEQVATISDVWTLQEMVALDNNHVVAVEATGGLSMWNLESGAREKLSPAGTYTSLVLLNGQRWVASDSDGVVLWDGMRNELRRASVTKISCMARIDDERVVCGTSTGHVVIWNLVTNERVRGANVSGPIHAVAAWSDTLIAYGTNSGVYLWWHKKAPIPHKQLFGHHLRITALIFLQNGRLVSGSEDDTACVWDVVGCALLRVLYHCGTVYALVTLGKDLFVTSSMFGKVQVWNSTTLQCEMTLNRSGVFSLAVLPNGGIIVSGNDVTVWM